LFMISSLVLMVAALRPCPLSVNGASEERYSQCQDLKPRALRSQSHPCRLIHPNSSTPFASSPTS
jgi:hypothetical protein